MVLGSTAYGPILLLLLLLLSQLPPSSPTRLEENCRSIEAAFSLLDGGTYFLSGQEYIDYSFLRRSEASVGPITELGLDGRVYHSAAAFTLEDGKVVFLRGCDYFTYSPTEDDDLILELHSEGQNWGGLPCSPDAAVTWGEDTLVFQGCAVWKYSNTTGRFTEDGLLSERGLPCHLDAAVEWRSGGAIFIKGSQLWRSTWGEMAGPLHSDELSLCSWYLCGEADWMEDRNGGQLACNGDPRLCSLRLNEVTLPGLHNAGSGFDGGFSLFDCWVRNHARSILEQLRLGIRHLDIDPSYHKCGLLGSNHETFCGGSICRLLKQVRTFLAQNPHEVVTLNFNHEIDDAELVFPALTRQLKTQLGPMLNNRFRRSHRHARWPRLRQAVRTNRRVFVFYAPDIRSAPYERQIYRRNTWIHTEHWLGSTWRPLPASGNCSQIVPLTRARCEARQFYQLLEVSVVPAPTWANCVDDMARLCRHYLHDALRACQPHRYRHGVSPNVLLVDYPEESAHQVNSVFHAVYHQNVRNLHMHRPTSCKVQIDAAVRRPNSDDEFLFFVGSKVIIYSRSQEAQAGEREIPRVSSVDAAYVSQLGDIVITKDCRSQSLNATSLLPLADDWSDMRSCDSASDAAMIWDSQLYTFKGCNVTIQGQPSASLTEWGLPCDLDAALTFGEEVHVFKDNQHWVRRGEETSFRRGGDTLDWTIDAVQC